MIMEVMVLFLLTLYIDPSNIHQLFHQDMYSRLEPSGTLGIICLGWVHVFINTGLSDAPSLDPKFKLEEKNPADAIIGSKWSRKCSHLCSCTALVIFTSPIFALCSRAC